MRLELTRIGLLAELANHYTTRGAFILPAVCVFLFLQELRLDFSISLDFSTFAFFIIKKLLIIVIHIISFEFFYISVN